MGRPKKKKISPEERLKRILDAGLKTQAVEDTDPGIQSLSERIQAILQITRSTRNPEQMLFIVMYDIENNKVRTRIAKYLLEKGCVRIQKSVYLAETKHRVYEEIVETLKEIQGMYENDDSILFVPISAQVITGMQIVGKDIQIQAFIDPPNTVFF